jgi:hypothetical protein
VLTVQIYGVANATAAVFLTQIIGRFGYSTVHTNLMTVGPYSVAVVILCECWAADLLRHPADLYRAVGHLFRPPA